MLGGETTSSSFWWTGEEENRWNNLAVVGSILYITIISSQKWSQWFNQKVDHDYTFPDQKVTETSALGVGSKQAGCWGCFFTAAWQSFFMPVPGSNIPLIPGKRGSELNALGSAEHLDLESHASNVASIILWCSQCIKTSCLFWSCYYLC